MSKGERSVKLFLENQKIKFTSQKTFKKCEYKSVLKFDFYLPKFNVCIEYDGEQHFKPMTMWGGSEEFHKIQKRDEIKNYFCMKNNIKLLRIPYWDIENVHEIINDVINKIMSNN